MSKPRTVAESELGPEWEWGFETVELSELKSDGVMVMVEGDGKAETCTVSRKEADR